MSGDLRLTTREMAYFVARGFLRLDEVVPEPLNRAFLEAAARDGIPSNPAGTPLADCWRDGGPTREIFGLPRVAAVIRSLVGDAPVFDHQFLHVRKGPERHAQHFHQDSTIDPRETSFDVQLFYFPQRTTRRNGGTRFLPGSHLRRVNEAAIARYFNFVGQKHVECEPGTILVMHHGIWHGGGCNRSEQERLLFKVRLNPTQPQVRLWNLADWTEEERAPRTIFHASSFLAQDIQASLCRAEPWFEHDAQRLEFINRARLFRALLGDDDFDAHYWLTRLERQQGPSPFR